jgi:hypothetical protein
MMAESSLKPTLRCTRPLIVQSSFRDVRVPRAERSTEKLWAVDEQRRPPVPLTAPGTTFVPDTFAAHHEELVFGRVPNARAAIWYRSRFLEVDMLDRVVAECRPTAGPRFEFAPLPPFEATKPMSLAAYQTLKIRREAPGKHRQSSPCISKWNAPGKFGIRDGAPVDSTSIDDEISLGRGNT